MNFYGMDPDVVQSVGKQVYNLHPEASSAVNGVLGAYSDAAGVVHHPLVSAAMSTYRETHQKGHLSFVHAVSNLGTNTANGGATIADANNESCAVLQVPLADAQALTRTLNQPINSG